MLAETNKKKTYTLFCSVSFCKNAANLQSNYKLQNLSPDREA